MTTRGAMLWAVLVAVAVAGCGDEAERLDGLATAQQSANGTIAVTGAYLEAEVLARKLGDIEALAAAKSYTDSKVGGGAEGLAAKLDAEVARATAAEFDAVAQAKAALDGAKAHADEAVAALAAKVPQTIHLVGPKGEDLGVYLFGSVAWVAKLGAPVDFGRRVSIQYEGPNCTGNAWLSWNEVPAQPSANLRYIGPALTLWKTTGAQQQLSSMSVRGFVMGKAACSERGGQASVFAGVAAVETMESATSYDPATLSIEAR